MRLIDADALEPMLIGDCTGDMMQVYAVEEVDNAPTIDAKPVVRGHWLTFDSKIPTNKSGLGVFCSVCNLYADNMFDYCPNCGADMRGENDGTD